MSEAINNPVQEVDATDITKSENAEKRERTFTQEELNTILQKRLSEERDKAKLEADRKAAMSLAQREQELAAKEEEFRRLKQGDAASRILVERGMLSGLSKFLDYTNEVTLQDSINELEQIFKASVQAGVEARFKLNGYIPRGTAASASISSPKSSNTRGNENLAGSALDPDEAFENALRR